MHLEPKMRALFACVVSIAAYCQLTNEEEMNAGYRVWTIFVPIENHIWFILWFNMTSLCFITAFCDTL